MCQIFNNAPVFRTFQTTATAYYNFSFGKWYFPLYFIYRSNFYFSIGSSSFQLFYLCSTPTTFLDAKTVWIDSYHFYRRCYGYIGKCFSGKNGFTNYKTIACVWHCNCSGNQPSFKLSSYTRCNRTTSLIMSENNYFGIAF